MFSIFQRKTASGPSQTTQRTRPSLEALESRLALTTNSWVGASGMWAAGSNWSLGHVPAATEVAVINTASPVTVTVQPSDVIKIKTLTTGVNDTLAITGGMMTMTYGASNLNGPLSMTGGQLYAYGTGVKVTVNGATSVMAANAPSGAGLFAEAGATLSLPKLSSVVANAVFQADGKYSVLDMSHLTTLTETIGGGVNAYFGGKVNLSSLTSFTGNTTVINDQYTSVIMDAKLTTLNGVKANLDGTDKAVMTAWKSFNNAPLCLSFGSYTPTALTNIDGATLVVQGGGKLTLPSVVSFTSNAAAIGAYTDLFQAWGTGSVLSLANLKTVTQKGNWMIEANVGGQVNISSLTSLVAANGAITLNDLAGGKILDAKVTTLSGVNCTLDGKDTLVANSWKSFTNGTLTVTGGAYNLPTLTNIDGSMLFVQGGGSLTLPSVVTFTTNPADTGVYQDYFKASGTNSVLSLANLSTVTVKGNWTVAADSGAQVNLSGLKTLIPGPGLVSMQATTGGKILETVI